MIAEPNARSHGDGAATGALTAFTGMSAANAGIATETANAATTDITTLFIEPAPFRFDRLSADTNRPSLSRTIPFQTPAAIDPYAKGRALGLNLHMRRRLASSRKRDHLPPFWAIQASIDR